MSTLSVSVLVVLPFVATPPLGRTSFALCKAARAVHTRQNAGSCTGSRIIRAKVVPGDKTQES